MIAKLRLLRAWANRSFDSIAKQVNEARAAAGIPERTSKSTVADCFALGRSRPDEELLLAIVYALRPDTTYVSRWQQALRVIRGEAEAAIVVHVADGLPDDLVDFTGRRSEVERLIAELGAAGAPAVAMIDGMPGVGKTWFALHVAHRLRHERVFDRVLFVDLRGYHQDSSQPSAAPIAVLDALLRLLGVPSHRIPHELADRVELFRTTVGGQRLLLMLDNAASTEQARPLIAAGPHCTTLITSRRALVDLPGVRVSLDVFTAAESAELLGRAAGPERQAAEGQTAAVIAELLGHLPLALATVASRIHSDVGWTLADHLDRLVAPGGSPYNVGDLRVDKTVVASSLRLDDPVERALSVSYEALPSDQRRIFRLLGLHPGADIDVHATAALVDIDKSPADTQLDALVDNSLLRRLSPGRYALHDLVRAHAAALAYNHDRRTERDAALTRLFDYYLAAAALALHHIGDLPIGEPLPRPVPPRSLPDLRSSEQAVAWLTNEYTNLVGLAVHAAHHGWPSHASDYSTTLHRHLMGAGRYAEAMAVHEAALRSGRDRGDRTQQATALGYLGSVLDELGRYAQAREALLEALELSRAIADRRLEARVLNYLGTVEVRTALYNEATAHFHRVIEILDDIGDAAGSGRALNNLGIIHLIQGQHDEAIGCYQRAIDVHRRLGDRRSLAQALGNLGILWMRLGRYPEALASFDEIFKIFEAMSDLAGLGATLDNIGIVNVRLGRPEAAIDSHARALQIFRDIGNRASEAEALTHLAEACREQALYAQARAHHEAALALAREIGDRHMQAEALNAMGRTLTSVGDVGGALGRHREALALAQEQGELYEEGQAHHGVALALLATGDRNAAGVHGRQAIDLFERLGVPEVDDIRRLMDERHRDTNEEATPE